MVEQLSWVRAGGGPAMPDASGIENVPCRLAGEDWSTDPDVGFAGWIGFA